MTLGDEKMKQSLEILDRAARELSKLGADNITISEMFFTYGIRQGLLCAGPGMLATARHIIDKMGQQSSGTS